MKQMEEILKKENSYMKSRIEGLSDLLWSMGARCITCNCEELVKDFVLVNIGSGYTYRLWVALIYAAVVMIIVNVTNYLIYRNRRAI